MGAPLRRRYRLMGAPLRRRYRHTSFPPATALRGRHKKPDTV